jgi:hypothetical protein
MLFLRDGEIMPGTNNSGSMKSLRQSETTTGKTTASISKEMDHQATLELSLESLQDGGNCSRKTVSSLSMRKERCYMFQEELMLKTEILRFKPETDRYIKDSRSSMLTSTLKSQLRVNSMRNSAFMSKEISMLYHHSTVTDIST